MKKRKVTELSVPGGSPAGSLVQVGGMLFSSSISGVDPETGRLSDRPQEQIDAAFANLKRLLAQADASLDEVGLVTVCLSDERDARHVDQVWSGLFSDERNRPARKINEYALSPGQKVQLQVVGVVGSRRQPITAPGFPDALPLGVRMGDVVFSSVIDGRDPATGLRSGDRKIQMRQAFQNLETFITRAGGRKEDLIHVFIFARGRDDQADMLDAWLEAFPTDGERPARKAIFDETLERDSKIIHLLCVGVIGRGERFDLEVPGISKKHPNPMGAKIGGLLFSSGIGGDDPSGKKISNKDVSARAAMTFQNMRTFLDLAGGDLADIGLVSITVNDYADESAILEQWRRIFPDPADEPARHVMAFGGRGSYPVQVHVIAALGDR